MKYIITGSFKEYKDYLERNRLNPGEYKYVSDITVLRNLNKDSQIIFTGRYYSRNDISEIIDFMRSSKMKSFNG